MSFDSLHSYVDSLPVSQVNNEKNIFDKDLASFNVN